MSSNVDHFFMANAKNFRTEAIPNLKALANGVDDSKFQLAAIQNYKDPTIILLMSLFFGGFAVDRFMLGHIGLGILKLITFGGFGFWVLFDWFVIMGKARDYNQTKLMQALS